VSPAARCFRQVTRCEEWSPSLRSSAPISPGCVQPSARRRISSLYDVVNWRRGRRAVTSGTTGRTPDPRIERELEGVRRDQPAEDPRGRHRARATSKPEAESHSLRRGGRLPFTFRFERLNTQGQITSLAFRRSCSAFCASIRRRAVRVGFHTTCDGPPYATCCAPACPSVSPCR
jgi:hypothetical protein